MHNNDPREVSGTRPVKRLSFNEAEQLAFYGAKILHPFCIAPARLRNIVLVRLLNSMDRRQKHANFQPAGRQYHQAIAAKDHIIYIKFESNHNLCPYLFISKIFDIFAKYVPPLPAGIFQSGRICGYRRLHSFIEHHLRTTPICPCIGRRPHDHRLRGGQHAMGICRV